MYTWTNTYCSALEVSGNWCLHLHYLEAATSISSCLSLRGMLGMAVWLGMVGMKREFLRQREAVEACVLNPLIGPP